MFTFSQKYDADAAGAGSEGDKGKGDDQNKTTQSTAPDFDTWFGALDDQHKELVNGHVKGLKSALQSERNEKADIARQIKDLQGKVEKGSETEKALADLSSKYEQAERKTGFLEEAIRPDVGCVNPKAAYALAVAEDLFDKRGAVSWDALKKAAPELFRQPSKGNGNPGAGTEGQPNKNVSMNEYIRTAAGK